jgi:uncharacterized protein YukE
VITAEPSTWEGAGFVSSYADLSDALTHEQQVDPGQVAFAAAGAGLDTLGVVADPFGSLLEAGFGWLIEHVDVLREPLDALAGDPGAVLDQARVWQGVATELRAAAAGHREAVAGVTTGWDGAAAEAYALAAQRCTEAMDDAARDAGQLAELVVSTGAAVGTVRALIRDAIAAFLSKVVTWVAGALATAAFTAGFSLMVLGAAVAQQAASLALTFTRRISALLDLLDEAGTAARELGEAVRSAAAQLRPVVAGAETLESAAKRVGAPVLIEAGKQVTGAEQEQRDRPGTG